VGSFPDGNFENTAKAVSYGWNMGLMYSFNCATRLGLSYRSRVRHRLEGEAVLDLPSPLLTSHGTVALKLTLPDSVNLSAYHHLNPCWDLLASINYTHWSLINVVNLHYSGLITQNIQQASLAVNFKDTYRYSIGANFSPTRYFKLKGGVAYDETPVRNASTRTFRIPDSDRYWVSVGAQYQFNRCLALDVGYSHLFVRKAAARQTQSATLTTGTTLVANVVGDFDLGLDEFGLQLTWTFV